MDINATERMQPEKAACNQKWMEADSACIRF